MKKKFNWKHILFHLIGFWLFSHAFRLLAFLNNVAAAEKIRLSKDEKEVLTTLSLSKLVVSIAIGFYVGCFVALCISLVAASRVKGSYINTIIAFVVFLILVLLGLTGWSYISAVVMLPGSPFEGWLYYVANASVLLALGIFFIVRIRKFYDTKNNEQPPALPQYA